MNKVLKFVGLALLLLPMMLIGGRYSIAEKIFTFTGDTVGVAGGDSLLHYNNNVEVGIQRFSKSYLVVLYEIKTPASTDTLKVTYTPYIAATTTDIMPLQATSTTSIALTADGVHVDTLAFPDIASIYDIEILIDDGAYTIDSITVEAYIVRLERFRK